jgi:hypothetical protein
MNYHYKVIFLFMIIFAMALFPPVKTGFAQSEIQVLSEDWDSNFRDFLTFSVDVQSSSEIAEVELLYRVVGQLATSRNMAEFTPGSAVSAEFSLDQSEPINYMPPGTELEYWWSVTDTAGNELRTDRTLITLPDNRYDWNTLTDDRVTLYWYEGDDAFGQALFERATSALDTLQEDIGIGLERPIKVFIYGSHKDLLAAISSNAQEWTGGQAFTEHGVVVIGIAPRQLDWGLNAMTHEMTHLVIHQATDNPYGDLPRWLDEGIAVYNENRDELDEDFRPIFDRAVANDSLMTLRTLSSPFPADPLKANLAYGQSGAVVKYIVDEFGSDAMGDLLDVFAEGALYDEALVEVLGVDTDGLDNQFRSSVGLPPLPAAGATTEQPATSEDVQTESAEVEPDPAVEQDGVSEAAPPSADDPESAPAEAPAPQPVAEDSGGLLAAIPCLAGFLALVLMGGWLLVGGRRV